MTVDYTLRNDTINELLESFKPHKAEFFTWVYSIDPNDEIRPFADSLLHFYSSLVQQTGTEEIDPAMPERIRDRIKQQVGLDFQPIILELITVIMA